MPTQSPLTKAVLLLCLMPFLHACVAGSLIIKKEDLSDITARLERLEERLLSHSNRLDLLFDLYTDQYPLLLQQQRLLLQDIEQNTRSFEYLEELIRQNQNESRRRWMALRVMHDSTPETDPGFRPASTKKLLVGEIEKVRLTPPGRGFHARIDTGATTSSLDARDIELFERDGARWVRFKIQDPADETLYALEKPVIRRVRILQSGTTDPDRRPVVRLQIQLGRISLVEEFTLVDRTHLDYQVLIGRNILRDLMVVDVSRRFIVPLPEADNGGNGKRQ